MNAQPKESPPKPLHREDRVAAALRENLRKRKAQAQKRTANTKTKDK
jgi:hypothetical protein